MDTATLTIGLLSIAVCAMPFVLMSVNKSNKQKYLFNALSGIAAQQNRKLMKYEISGNIAIGMDENAGFVFFFRKPFAENRNGTGQLVNLAEVRECKLIKASAAAKDKNSNGKTERLELIFSLLSDNQKEMRWELYNADENPQLVGELELAEKWAKIINDKLSR